MNHFTRFFNYFSHFLFIFCLMLAGCKTTKSSIASTSKSATASETASRRTFYRSLDSLSSQLNLTAESLTITFHTDSAFQPSSKPKSLKIYGLHLNKSMKEKSVDSADLNDSVNTFTQSENIKSATKQKSAPAKSPHHYVFFIFVVLLLFIFAYLKKRFQ